MLAPMNFTPRPLSKHHRARLIAWTLAMLVWMTQVLFAAAPFTSRQQRQRGPLMSLDRLTRMVKLLIISRAIDFTRRRYRAPPRKPSFRGLAVAPRAVVRALIGARVQKLLKRKDVGDRIAVLLHAIRHIDVYAARVARRMKRGLTRRWRALLDWKAARDALVLTLASPLVCFADSS
jgi:hypothetical protein